LFQPLAQVKRAGITLTPEYIIRNLLRDGISSRVVSRSGGLGGVPLGNIADMAVLIMTAKPDVNPVAHVPFMKKRREKIAQAIRDYEAFGGGFAFEANYHDRKSYRKVIDNEVRKA